MDFCAKEWKKLEHLTSTKFQSFRLQLWNFFPWFKRWEFSLSLLQSIPFTHPGLCIVSICLKNWSRQIPFPFFSHIISELLSGYAWFVYNQQWSWCSGRCFFDSILGSLAMRFDQCVRHHPFPSVAKVLILQIKTQMHCKVFRVDAFDEGWTICHALDVKRIHKELLLFFTNGITSLNTECVIKSIQRMSWVKSCTQWACYQRLFCQRFFHSAKCFLL